MAIPVDQASATHVAATLTGDASIPLLDGDIGGALRLAAKRFSDRPALLQPDDDVAGFLTYAELLRRAEQAAWWVARRAGKGDRAAIWSRNTLDWIVLEYGCALAGVVVTGWNTAWTDPECRHALELAEPRLLLAGRDVRGTDLAPRARSLGAGCEVHAIDGALRERLQAATPCPLPALDAGDPFLLQFTSGTTGRPKGAVLSHGAALNAAWLRARSYGADETDVWLNPVPLHHVGGSISMVLGAMTTGGAYVVMHRFVATEYGRLMHATGATRVGGVPTMLIDALDQPDWRPGRAVRSVGLGGAQVPAALIERVRAAFQAPVVVAYGQSECPLIASSLPDDDPRLATESVGRAAPHVAIRICAAGSDRPLRVGEVGEILVRAPTVMRGYLGMPDETAAAIGPDGFLRTGDLGSVDPGGVLRIHGRRRDVIIRGGENIYPAEVEAVLLGHPAVAAVAVVGVADPRYGQQVAAAIVLRVGADATAPELEAHAAGALSHFKVPRRWRFEGALPMTASGKIRKTEVEALFRPPADRVRPG